METCEFKILLLTSKALKDQIISERSVPALRLQLVQVQIQDLRRHRSAELKADNVKFNTWFCIELQTNSSLMFP